MDELVLTRVLDAPLNLVWKVWTDSVHLAKWWGPAGFTMKVAKLDLKAGGMFHYAMTPPGAKDAMWGKFTYDEVTPQSRLEYRSAFADAQGNVIRNPWSPEWPLEVKNVMTFEAQGDKTMLTLRGNPWNATPEEDKFFATMHANVQKGFAGTFAQLEAHLSDELVADRAIVYKRTFAAPRPLVWKAWTSPTSIAAWWGPSGFGNTIAKMEVKVGGQWDYLMHGPDGVDYPNLVTYLEVEEPRRMMYDHGDKGKPDQFRVTVTFDEVGAETHMVYRMVFPTAEAKQQAVDKYGATEGLKQNMDRFTEWLTKKGLVLTRAFNAPRAAVWKAWTNPEQLKKWWGPEDFTCPGAQIDLKIGGKYLLGMKGPDGQEFWGTGVYKEIILNQKLVYTDNFSDAEGNIVSPASLGLPGDWPDQSVTVTFAELGPKKTLVTVHQGQLPEDWKDMTVSGWSTSFDKLAKVLS